MRFIQWEDLRGGGGRTGTEVKGDTLGELLIGPGLEPRCSDCQYSLPTLGLLSFNIPDTASTTFSCLAVKGQRGQWMIDWLVEWLNGSCSSKMISCV